jgi:YD repeat-containing protein
MGNNAYQLINESRTGSASYQLSWTYDNVGNRLTQDKWDGSITTTTTSTYNNANQLLSTVEGGITTTNYTYDNNGNQTGKTIGADTWVWAYDYENRQISFDAPGTTTDGSYVYNASGARIQKTVNLFPGRNVSKGNVRHTHCANSGTGISQVIKRQRFSWISVIIIIIPPPPWPGAL